MSKKVSELTKELDITLQELKDYADKMGITISGVRGSVDDVDADRLIRSINLIKGNATGTQSGSSKPKIRAVPVVPKKEGRAGRPPIGKPVIPKKSAAESAESPEGSDAQAEAVSASISEEQPLNEKADAVTDAPVSASEADTEGTAATENISENTETKETASEGTVSVTEESPANSNTSDNKEADNDVNASDAAVNAPEKSSEDVSDKAEQQKSDNNAEAKTDSLSENETEKTEAAQAETAPSKEPEEEYVNAPNKPMRFKKISDAAT
jgi:translation initiation factor IF-2